MICNRKNEYFIMWDFWEGGKRWDVRTERGLAVDREKCATTGIPWEGKRRDHGIPWEGKRRVGSDASRYVGWGRKVQGLPSDDRGAVIW